MYWGWTWSATNMPCPYCNIRYVDQELDECCPIHKWCGKVLDLLMLFHSGSEKIRFTVYSYIWWLHIFSHFDSRYCLNFPWIYLIIYSSHRSLKYKARVFSDNYHGLDMQSCSILLQQKIPNDIYIDMYEMKNKEQFNGSKVRWIKSSKACRDKGWLSCWIKCQNQPW